MVFKIIWSLILFCNVAAIGMILSGDAEVSPIMSWINLAGCVIFGWYLREITIN